jgi:hypothetical protein
MPGRSMREALVDCASGKRVGPEDSRLRPRARAGRRPCSGPAAFVHGQRLCGLSQQRERGSLLCPSARPENRVSAVSSVSTKRARRRPAQPSDTRAFISSTVSDSRGGGKQRAKASSPNGALACRTKPPVGQLVHRQLLPGPDAEVLRQFAPRCDLAFGGDGQGRHGDSSLAVVPGDRALRVESLRGAKAPHYMARNRCT